MKIKKGAKTDDYRRQSSTDAVQEFYADARAKLRRAEMEQEQRAGRALKVDRNSGFAGFPEYGDKQKQPVEPDQPMEEETSSESDYDDTTIPPFYVSGNSAPTRNFPRGVYDSVVDSYGIPLQHRSDNGEFAPVTSEDMLYALIAEAHFNGLPIPVFTLTERAQESFWRDENMDFYVDPPVSVPGPEEEQRARTTRRSRRRGERPPLPAFWVILQKIISNVISFASQELRPVGEEIQKLFNSFEPELQEKVQSHMGRIHKTGMEAAARARESNIRVCVGDKEFSLDNLFEALNLDIPPVAGDSTVDHEETPSEAASETPSFASSYTQTHYRPDAPFGAQNDLWRPRQKTADWQTRQADQKFNNQKFTDKFSDRKFAADSRFAADKFSDNKFSDNKFSDNKFSDNKFAADKFSSNKFTDNKFTVDSKFANNKFASSSNYTDKFTDNSSNQSNLTGDKFADNKFGADSNKFGASKFDTGSNKFGADTKKLGESSHRADNNKIAENKFGDSNNHADNNTDQKRSSDPALDDLIEKRMRQHRKDFLAREAEGRGRNDHGHHKHGSHGSHGSQSSFGSVPGPGSGTISRPHSHGPSSHSYGSAHHVSHGHNHSPHGHSNGLHLGHHLRPTPPPSRAPAPSTSPSVPSFSGRQFHAVNLSSNISAIPHINYGPPTGPPPGHVAAQRRAFSSAYIPPAGTVMSEVPKSQGSYTSPAPRSQRPATADLESQPPHRSPRHTHSSQSLHSTRSARSSKKSKQDALSEAEKHKIEVSEYYKQYWMQYFANHRDDDGEASPPPPPHPPVAPVSMPEVDLNDVGEDDEKTETEVGQIRLSDSEFESEDDIWVEATREEK